MSHPILLAFWPSIGLPDYDHGILRVSLDGETLYYGGRIEPFEDALGRRRWEPVDLYPQRHFDIEQMARRRMVMDYGCDMPIGAARAEEWNLTNKARTFRIEEEDEEAFDAFRDRIRKHVTEGLDALIIELFHGNEAAAKERISQNGIGCTDADLTHLFSALDKQARVLWERGMRKQMSVAR